MSHEVHETGDARSVAIDEFLVGKLTLGFGGAGPSVPERGARILFQESALKLSKRPMPECAVILEEIDFFGLWLEKYSRRTCPDLGHHFHLIPYSFGNHSPRISMRYKIELQYTYGWDDAGWTDETGHKVEPERFASAAEAQLALREYFELRKAAVADGNMDSDAESSNYRIVEASD